MEDYEKGMVMKMKRKKGFMKILSAFLSAAMLLTMVPAEKAIAQQPSAEWKMEDNTAAQQEIQPGEEAVAVQQEIQPGEEAAAVQQETQAGEEAETQQETQTQGDEGTKTAVDKTIDLTAGYWGPTIDYNPESSTAGAVTIYYYAQNFTEEVTEAHVKGAWAADWNDWVSLTSENEAGMFSVTMPLEKTGRDKSFQYGFGINAGKAWDTDDCNPAVGGNSEIKRNPVVNADSSVTLYYYPAHGAYPESVKVKYRSAGTDGTYTESAMALDAVHSKIYSVTLKGLADGDYEYVFEADGTEIQDTNNVSTGRFSVSSYPQPDENKKSPEVNGKEVTFHYYGPVSKKVQLAGSMTAWGDGAEDMIYDNATGYWSLTLPLAAGTYDYKFIVDGTWMTDPLNEKQANGNSVFSVTGLENKEFDAAKGKGLVLPSKLSFFDEAGVKTAKNVTYRLSAETAAADFARKLTLEADTETTLTVAADFPEEVTTFTLTADDAEGNTGIVTIHVVSKVYKYTIYYYNPEHTKETAALWLWNTSGAGATEPTYFTEEEVLSDENTWMKAVVEAGYIDMSIIPRAYDNWDWQEDERTYVNGEEAPETTLYIVADDGAGIYTELPEIKKTEQRYLIAEYVREEGSAQDWYFFTWNSGYGSNVFVPFTEINGVWTAKVKIKNGLDSISYCIEKGGDKWLEKDGGDYIYAIPADQTVVKIRMEEGKGITYQYPYNTGYDMAPSEGKIHFYYRDDNAFAQGSEGGLYSAEIEIDGEVYAMEFDEQTQRYTYDFDGLLQQDYKYRYVLQREENSEKEYVTDKYNEKTIVENENTYSVCTYKAFEAEAQASVWNASMDYNDNNVLTVSLKGKEGADISEMKVTAAEADLTALGQKEKTAIDPALMELSFAVKEGTAAGEKTIPVTLYDEYNNEYRTNAKVNVTQRNKNGSFDWDEAIIYFVLTDRFYDGNKANNGNGYDTGENGSSSYHGGDFKGLTEKLGYLQELGVNTIWITPIVENKMETGLQTDIAGITSWGYHGYWASNFEKLDSHLGTENEFKTLLNAAHSRGMKIMVDVVLNHSGYNMEEYFNGILKDEEGNPDRMLRNSTETVNGSDKLSSLSGLPDFLTEKEEVRNLLVQWQSNWVSKYDIDYYRVDTVKHVDDTTWSAFKNALTKIKPDFKMIGEWAGAGYATDTGMLRTGRMDSLLDFDFNGVAEEFVTGNVSATERFMNARNAAIDNTASLGSFLSSHDEDGFTFSLMQKKMDEETARAYAKVAASLQMTAKGQVVVYYGEEIGMTGENNYPYQTNRYDFDWTLVNENNDMLTHYKKLLAIRNAYSEVLAKGTRSTICANDKDKDVFARSYGNTTVYTALNLSSSETTYTLTGQTPGTFLLDLYNEKVYFVGENGEAEISVPAAKDGGTAILTESAQGDPFHVECVKERTYTGKNILLEEEELKVYYGLQLLEKGKDYKVSYKNNRAVGTASVTVTATGNYTGKDTVDFRILPKNIGDEDITIEYKAELIANKKDQQPFEKMKIGSGNVGSKEYKVEYFALDEDGKQTGTALKKVKAAGVYDMVITGLYDAEKKKGSFTGSTIKKITVYPTGTYVKNTTITIGGSTKIYNTPYTGEEIKPQVKVVLKDKAKTVLQEGEHFTVSYKKNTEVGTAQAVITGIPGKGLVGTITKTFNITGIKLSAAAQVDTANWKDKVPYDVTAGCAVQPVDENGKNLVTLTGKGNYKTTLFTEETDYVISYSKNDRAGKATMIFTGIGKYTGTVTKTFNVAKVTLKEEDEKLLITADTKSSYRKKGSKINVSVSYGGIALTEGEDYKVTYSDNKAVTTENTKKKPAAVISGIGSFGGKIKKEFTILPTDLSTLQMTAADAAYQNKKGKFISAPAIFEADKTKLAANKDYTCTYYLMEDGEEILLSKADVVDAGAKIKVVAAAKGASYTGSISSEYKITVQDISKAAVTIKAQVYTGKAITVTEEDFSKIKVGDTALKLGKHYEITGDYTDNINKGTAKVTIKGIGNYGGTKTVTFKITSRPMAWWWNLLH